MPKTLHVIKGFYRYFPAVGGYLANLAICAMTLIVTVTAVTRYVFNWTPGWADSVCAFLVAFTVFMGAGYTLAKGEHVRITFLFKKLPPGIQLAVELVCGLLALLYVGYLAYSTTELAMMSSRLNSRTPDGLLLTPLQIWLPIGLLMLMVAIVRVHCDHQSGNSGTARRRKKEPAAKARGGFAKEFGPPGDIGLWQPPESDLIGESNKTMSYEHIKHSKVPQFDLVPQIGRVPRMVIDLNPEEEGRASQITREAILIDFHSHPIVLPKNMEEYESYSRRGRYHTGYAGLKQAGLTACFDGMGSLAYISSTVGWQFEDVVYELGMRFSDFDHHRNEVTLGRFADDIRRAKKRARSRSSRIWRISGRSVTVWIGLTFSMGWGSAARG